MDEADFFKNEDDFTNYLFDITGLDYSFAVSSDRMWGNKKEKGTFYQLMPDSIDNGFFDWYCDRCPYHQFFKLKTEAVLRFMKYWWEWGNLKK
ncbi:hypothetical protein BH10BAC2_BH10BAC2_17890 [soil metagenome]